MKRFIAPRSLCLNSDGDVFSVVFSNSFTFSVITLTELHSLSSFIY